MATAQRARLSDRELYEAMNVAIGDIECNPQTRALLTKVTEELAKRVIEQESGSIG